MFSDEHNKFIVEAYFRSGKRDEDGQWIYSSTSCADQLQISPNKSLRHLSAQSGLLLGICHKATKILHLHPYKLTVIQELLPTDYGKRIKFCEWFQGIFDNELLDLTFFSDEAWFHLSGYVNSQNYRTWSSENPHVFVETSLHPLKIGVWLAMSRRRIIGPIFFNETINSDRYQNLILQPFIDQLMDDELQQGFFQQDGAPAHSSNATMEFLRQYYDQRIISNCYNWPPRSPDLTPLDFFVFGHLKDVVYRERLHNLEELQVAITNAVNNITKEQMENVFQNLRNRVHLCVENRGHHFEHYL